MFRSSTEVAGGSNGSRSAVHFGGYWLGTQGADRISVYYDDVRTNNLIEAFNRWFNAKCVIPKNNFWDFFSK